MIFVLLALEQSHFFNLVIEGDFELELRHSASYVHLLNLIKRLGPTRDLSGELLVFRRTQW